MKYLFILNDRAGRAGVHERLLSEINSLCRARGLDYTVAIPESGEAARDTVREACAAGDELRIYACGGDGTFGGVVDAAARYPHASVGVIPIGTGNDFVRNFGQNDVFRDIAAQLDGEEVRIDLLACNGRLCANMINVGFDCEVALTAGKMRRVKMVGEKLAYISGVVVNLIRKPGVTLASELDGETDDERKLLLIAIANGAFCGGGFKAAPVSRLDDGQMDVVMVSNISRTRFATLAGAYHDGTYLGLPVAKKLIRYRHGQKLSLRFPRPHHICVDGDIITADRLEVSLLPAALRFILPKGATMPTEETADDAACRL